MSSFFLGKHRGMRLLGHMIRACLTVQEPAKLLSKVAIAPESVCCQDF